MQTFTLDISAKSNIPLLYAKQRDVGSKILVKITNNGTEYKIPEDSTWTVWFSGKSGQGNYESIGDRSAFSIEGNAVIVELIMQMLNNPGEHVMCLVMMRSDGTQMGLWNIPYYVEEIPGADSESAKEYYQAFMAAQKKAEDAAERAEQSAEDAGYNAELTDINVNVTEFQKNEAINARHYAEEAATRAENAADRAESAAGGNGGSGVSPTVEITEIDGGHRVTITDVNGSKSFDVMDGEKGDPYELTAEDEANLVAAMLASEDIAQMKQDIEDIRADLDYKSIEITNFGCSAAGTHELGSTVTGMGCYWSLNKEPTKQTLRSETLDNSVRSKQYTGLNITTNTTVTLSVTDERGATDNASSSISFLNGVYHGVIADGAAVNNAAVLALTRSLQGSRGITFTANAGAGQRIAYAIPSQYGTPVFTVGGFEGGFSKVATISFTNASGYTENYDVWLSDNVALGSTTVKVS